MIEDRQKICNLLLPVLREIKGFYNVSTLEYRADRELVYIIFATGVQQVVNAGITSAQMVSNIMLSV